MKKLLCVLVLALCLAGCADQEAYMTKYIVNCDSTELRRKPSDDSEAIDQVKWGSEVNYVGSAENGYVKVIYQDTTGYVLSSCVAADKPVAKGNGGRQSYSYLINVQDEEEVQEQVAKVIKPLCADIDKKSAGYKKLTYGSETLWCDDLGCAKKEISDETNLRQYYFDTEKNELVFAVINRDKSKFQLYFQNDKLICYFENSTEAVYNPDDEKVLEMADKAIEEAYR